MRKKSSVCTALLLVALLVSACFVKEDRKDCPCHMALDFSGVGPGTVVDLFFTSADGFFFQKSVEVGKEKVFYLDVPRTDLQFTATYGTEDYFDASHGLVIPEYHQCPAVYMESMKLDTRRESGELEVCPRKNYCTVEICFEDIVHYHYDALISGDFSGYSVDGAVRRGPFVCPVLPGEDGHCTVRIPRQEDASLILELSDEDGHVKRFALGEYIAASGYDWKKPDLNDVIVEIDYACTEVRFTVNGWEKTVQFEVNI